MNKIFDKKTLRIFGVLFILNMLLVASLFFGLMVLGLGFFVDTMAIADYIIDILSIVTTPFEKIFPIEEALNESLHMFFFLPLTYAAIQTPFVLLIHALITKLMKKKNA